MEKFVVDLDKVLDQLEEDERNGIDYLSKPIWSNSNHIRDSINFVSQNMEPTVGSRYEHRDEDDDVDDDDEMSHNESEEVKQSDELNQNFFSSSVVSNSEKMDVCPSTSEMNVVMCVTLMDQTEQECKIQVDDSVKCLTEQNSDVSNGTTGVIAEVMPLLCESETETGSDVIASSCEDPGICPSSANIAELNVTYPSDTGLLKDVLRLSDIEVSQLTDSELDAYLREAELSGLFDGIKQTESEDVAGANASTSSPVVISDTVEHPTVEEPVHDQDVSCQSTCTASKPSRPDSLDLSNIVASSEDCEMINQNHDSNTDMFSDTEEDYIVGRVKPFWIPDNDTLSCMRCSVKFTVIKRRHHCRACGEVLCSQCCSQKSKLVYMDNKEARVCQKCYDILNRVSGPSNTNDSADHQACSQNQPDPSNPADYCSTVSPLDQANGAFSDSLSVLVPVGVLRHPNKPKGEPKQVIFSDGIRPGGDLTEADVKSQPTFSGKKSGRSQFRMKSPPIDNMLSPSAVFLKQGGRKNDHRLTVNDSNGPLPSIIMSSELLAQCNEKPDFDTLLMWLLNNNQPPVTFYLTKNLQVLCKIVNLNCCIQNEYWTFSSKGLNLVGQDEVLFVIERLPDEKMFPRDVFRILTTMFDSASRGTTYSDLSHILFPEGLFGSKENSGFVFIRPSFHCLKNLVLPPPPFLVGILIHKWEVPWIKIFPLRLLLRLGSEYKHYPYPIASYRQRKPSYCEVPGHTIMNVLADFRNFQYTLPSIPGLTIHMENKKTTISFPKNRYELAIKVLNNSNEHVLAFGANLSLKADSHLVCIQNDDGQYQTQTITLNNHDIASVTGANFVVFSGALKSSSGLTAKLSVVEDGLLIQLPPQTLQDLKTSLRDMKDFHINCGTTDISSHDETVSLIWSKDDTNFNIGVKSPIDNQSFDGVPSVRIYNGTDYASGKYLIRWNEVFFIQNEEHKKRFEVSDPTRLAEVISQALCIALTPHLDHLYDNEFTRLGLRVTLDPDRVGYEVGSKGKHLPSAYINELDGALIPVIMGNVAASLDALVVMELIFHILVK